MATDLGTSVLSHSLLLTADSARVSALPVTSVGQDNERTRPVTETVSPIPDLHFLSLTVCAGQLNFLSRCAL